MENIRIKSSLQKFNESITPVIDDLKELYKKENRSEYDLKNAIEKRDSFDEKIQIVFDNSFTDPDNWLWNNYESYGIGDFFGWYYIKSGDSIQDKDRKVNRVLNNKIEFLEKFIAVLSHSDTILKKEPLINIKEHSIDDILYLILFKLNKLKDKHFYSIEWILAGNGIVLPRGKDELREVIHELAKLYFINSSNDEYQITIKGELQLGKWQRSRKRKTVKDSKNSIDEVMKELKILGLGQEILFNELEELKTLSKTLNKKNWKQLVQGKIVDLTLSKIINKETATFIVSKILPNEDFKYLLSKGSENL
ncbi:hypothetical protein QYS49_32410 [Marivirga salinae]|uniref:Uncharacterized protein n=1 Tax=Marivirga salinarum TaxID=3059078 RepID=A0AA51NBI1_9BACT|nr:hypothetical protein [Marivirga sp. BDSF4-3]WMN12098.1 hypothetical protein QYS49_32410 [Marivirga sp. BDSF4-3]